MQRELFEGEEVMLLLDPEDLGVVPGMMKWNECIFTISRTVYASECGNPSGRNGIVYLELEGCVSEYGIPYSILREWVHPQHSLYRTGGVR